jgi:hypothetical protein
VLRCEEDVFRFLVKIANRFDLDLDAETRGLVQRAGEQSAETTARYRGELLASLRSLEQELLEAKRRLDLS